MTIIIEKAEKFSADTAWATVSNETHKMHVSVRKNGYVWCLMQRVTDRSRGYGKAFNSLSEALASYKSSTAKELLTTARNEALKLLA